MRLHRRSPAQDTDEMRQCTSRDTHRPPPRPLTASHEYAQSPTRNSGAGAVSQFATSTSITWPCVRSARESGGRSPSTIPRRPADAETRQRQAERPGAWSPRTQSRPPRKGVSARTTLRTVYETVLKPSGWLRRLRVGQGRQSSTWYLGDGSQPQSPCPALPTQGGANLEDRQRPPGFLPLRSGQAVLRPPGDLAGRARPARESDRRSARTARWSVAPTALDPLPPRTPQPTRTGPGG